MNSGSCPFCGREDAGVLAGLTCQVCLAAFVRQEAERVFVGDYELHEVLGEGGTSVVFRAEHRVSRASVAIKLAKDHLLERRDSAKLFLRQARTEGPLSHTHIVRATLGGMHEGRPFLVMPYMEQDTLAARANLVRLSTFDARVDVMVKIAKAVQFAHDRGVLHCDLKPENILFDGSHEPHVSDFGMARAVRESSADGFVGGSSGYMSREQVKREPLTTKSDVFALGALLYWLATGRNAFPTDDAFEQAVLTRPSPPLPRWRPGKQWSLLAIAHRAMLHDADQRYPTAAALVEDLERLQKRQMVQSERAPAVARLWALAERHPRVHFASVVLLSCFAAIALFVANTQRSELRKSALDMNAYAASGQAAAVLYLFRDYADAVQKAAEDPLVKALMLPALSSATGGDPQADSAPCGHRVQLSDPEPLRRYAASFSTMAVFDAHGCARARVADTPPPLEYMRQRFDWRDYFDEARRDGQLGVRKSWVRQAYRSSVSHLIKFAVSSPVFEDDAAAASERRWIGVVTGSINVASTLKLPRIRHSDGDRLTVVVGPFEGERPRPKGPRAPEFTFLAHPDLRRGEKVTLDPQLSAELHRRFNVHPAAHEQLELATAVPIVRTDYQDPFKGDRWLAAFAPVGATGHVVLVQSTDRAAIASTLFLSRIGYGLALAGALLASFGGFHLWSRIVDRRTAKELAERLPPE